jgi:hypothetical protein
MDYAVPEPIFADVAALSSDVPDKTISIFREEGNLRDGKTWPEKGFFGLTGQITVLAQ